MNIVFEESELANFISKVENWHVDKFHYVVLNMFKNFDPYRFCVHGEPIVDKQIREFIAKFEQQFESEHPQPKWRDLL